MRKEKITFVDVYNDFKTQFPTLSRGASHWKPNGYLSIQVFFQDGSEMTYDYSNKKGSFTILPGAAAQTT